MSENEIRSVINKFKEHLDVLRMAKADFLNHEVAPLYSCDFAVLYPYLVPKSLQRPTGDRRLKSISNNIFFSIDEKVKMFPFQIVIPFVTTCEIIEHFAHQKKYLDRMTESESFAKIIKQSILSGENTAGLIKEELGKASLPLSPDNTNYICLSQFCEDLKSKRITGYGDHIDISDFKKYLKGNNALDGMRKRLMKQRAYRQVDENDRAFHIDVDAIHLLLAHYFNNEGILYTGPANTRRTFGRESKKYARIPDVPLCLLHAINQIDDPRLTEETAISFFNRAIRGFEDYVNELETMRITRIEQIPLYERKEMIDFDKTYRRQMYDEDKREGKVKLVEGDLREIIEDYTEKDLREAYRSASESMGKKVEDLKDILEEEVNDDISEFFSPTGVNHVRQVFDSIKPKL